MNSLRTVFIVDDQVEEILWLLDLLRHRGYDFIVATNEKDANARLEAIHDGSEGYVAAIFDVMVSTLSFDEIVSSHAALDDKFFEKSKDTGLRLCRRARELGLNLPIACLTVRKDAAVEAVRDELNIPVYHRIPLDRSESIMDFLDRYLPPLESTAAKTRRRRPRRRPVA